MLPKLRRYNRKSFVIYSTPEGRNEVISNKGLIRSLFLDNPNFRRKLFDYRRKHVYRVKSPNGRVFFVKEIETRVRENLKHQLQKYVEMRQHGIQTPTPYFYFKHKLSGREFIVTEFVEGIPLERFAATARRRISIAKKSQVIEEIRKKLYDWADMGLRSLKIKGVSSLTGSNLILNFEDELKVYYVDPVNVHIKPNASVTEKNRQKRAVDKVLGKNNLIFLIKSPKGERVLRVKFDEIAEFLKSANLSISERNEVIRRLRKQGYGIPS